MKHSKWVTGAGQAQAETLCGSGKANPVDAMQRPAEPEHPRTKLAIAGWPLDYEFQKMRKAAADRRLENPEEQAVDDMWAAIKAEWPDAHLADGFIQGLRMIFRNGCKNCLGSGLNEYGAVENAYSLLPKRTTVAAMSPLGETVEQGQAVSAGESSDEEWVRKYFAGKFVFATNSGRVILMDGLPQIILGDNWADARRRLESTSLQVEAGAQGKMLMDYVAENPELFAQAEAELNAELADAQGDRSGIDVIFGVVPYSADDALNHACGLLDVIKQEWGESWTEHDQKVRAGLSMMIRERAIPPTAPAPAQAANTLTNNFLVNAQFHPLYDGEDYEDARKYLAHAGNGPQTYLAHGIAASRQLLAAQQTIAQRDERIIMLVTALKACQLQMLQSNNHSEYAREANDLACAALASAAPEEGGAQ